MENQPNNRTVRIHDQWRHLIYITLVLLGAAALFLRLSGGADDESFFLHSRDPTEEGHRDQLLRVTSSRKTLLSNCNRHHRRPNKCNGISGCKHNGINCVPENMIQFANTDADFCSQHHEKGKKCRRSGCAWNHSDRACKKPSHECEAYNGRVRICNSVSQCVFNLDSRQCELMSNMSAGFTINVCTKKSNRDCKGHSSCSWKKRQCSLTSSLSNTVEQQTQTQATQATQQVATTTKATTAAQGGLTPCLEWHPLTGQSLGAEKPIW